MKKPFKKQDTGFAQVKNDVLNDKKLSWKAKGLFAYLYSKPNNWDFSMWRIKEDSTNGKESTRLGLKELEDRGYLSRKRKSDGKMHYYITYLPCSENKNKESEPCSEKALFRKSEHPKIGTISNIEEEVIKKEHSNKDSVFSKEKTVSLKPEAYKDELVYEEVNTTYKRPFHIKKKRVLTDKQKAYLKNSELYQHFFNQAKALGMQIFEKESGGNAKMAKQAEYFLGIDESKKLISHYLKSCGGGPISFKSCLCEFNLINWKNKKPISYEEEANDDYLSKFYQ